MNILIYLDDFSGHLFHDIEIIQVLFYYYNDSNINLNLYKQKRLDLKNYFKIIDLLKIKAKIKIIEKIDKSIDFDIIINRDILDHGKINKPIKNYITNFPFDKWQSKLSSKKYTKNILYATRQNTKRRFSEESHLYICNMIKKYGGTICDLGEYNLDKQIEICRDHKCIIGIHGNNLSGISWMKKFCYCIEILPFYLKDEVYDYHCLSLSMRINYIQIDCKIENRDFINGIYVLNEENKKYVKHNLKFLTSI